jgi:ankyrin repeat protein
MLPHEFVFVWEVSLCNTQSWEPCHMLPIKHSLLLLSALHTHYQVSGTPLKEACYKNRPECAQLLIMRGADVNKPDNKGWTPLLSACNQGHPKCVRHLLSAKKLIISKPLPVSQVCVGVCCSARCTCLVHPSAPDLQQQRTPGHAMK